MTRDQEFTDLYKQLEQALEIKYSGKRRRYSSVIFEYIKDSDSQPVREKLETCREIRNLLAHTPNMSGASVVQPSQEIVEALRVILRFVKRPPLALSIATKSDMLKTVSLQDKVVDTMRDMRKNNFSHIPVMKDGKFFGVFSAGTIFDYVLSDGKRRVGSGCRICDIAEFVKIKNHTENYVFFDKNATMQDVRKRFERIKGRGQRVSAAFVTENGEENEQLLGMITLLDVAISKENIYGHDT